MQRAAQHKELYRPFRSVLIANRGEIAERIVREAHALGIRPIAIYSDADKDERHLRRADAAVRIGPGTARESYLRIDVILDAAKETNAEAIHPGYGFLAENADFAQAVIDAGIVWIGPTPEAIRAMGDKGRAKEIAATADVPLIPGYQGSDQSSEKLEREAARIGYPVMIKAANGGGGRGMRLVLKREDFQASLESAKREALSAFGSEAVILEKALDRVRHVEIQIFGDSDGNIVHLGERDCSVQRRYQKIIEEAPCPVVTPELRARMGEAAIRLAKAVGYVNAGTVEFLLDEKLNFYFLEMNTRIQVEHPVTELVTGLNLIALQFEVAEGKPLRFNQDDVKINGHAIEVRLCAEDPSDRFKPQVGEIVHYETANQLLRIDGDIQRGRRATPFYDSMLAKILTHDVTRGAARERLANALRDITTFGIRTNRWFLAGLLDSPEFRSAKVDIGWVDRSEPPVSSGFDGINGEAAALYAANGGGDAWRSTAFARTPVTLRERERTKTFVVENGVLNGKRLAGRERLAKADPSKMMRVVIQKGSESIRVGVVKVGDLIHVSSMDGDALFEEVTYEVAERKGRAGDGVLRAPMDGKIVAVRVEAGATVKKGQVLVVLEAMKMEHEITAAVDGTVESVWVKAGDQASTRQVLVTLVAAS